MIFFSGRLRLLQVRGSVALLYFVAAMGTLRFFGDAFDIHPLPELGSLVVMSIAIQIGLVWATRHGVSPID
jgi:hypothetical protein